MILSPCIYIGAVIFAIVFSWTGLEAQTIRRVPSQYSTIGEAIDASNSNDIIEVEPGRYTGVATGYGNNGPGNVRLSFGSRNLTLRSSTGRPTDVVIDCRFSGFRFLQIGGLVAGSNSEVSGITIENCNGDGRSAPTPFDAAGGAIEILSYGNTLIKNCIFKSNSSRIYITPGSIERARGGAIGIVRAGTGVRIENNIFSTNRAAHGGGAIWGQFDATTSQSTVEIIGNKFYGNEVGAPQASSIVGHGAHVHLTSVDSTSRGNIVMDRNEFWRGLTHDPLSFGSAVYTHRPGGLRISNSLFAYNRPNPLYSQNLSFLVYLGLANAGWAPRPALANNTFVGNVAHTIVGLGPGSPGDILNSIMYGNVSPTGQPARIDSSIFVQYSADDGFIHAGTGNFRFAGPFANPLFVDEAGLRACQGVNPFFFTDYHLHSSANIFRGRGGNGYITAPTHDIDGEPRNPNSIDIGYDQFNPNGTLLVSGRDWDTGFVTRGGCALLSVIGAPSVSSILALSLGVNSSGQTFPGIAGILQLSYPLITGPTMSPDQLGLANFVWPMPTNMNPISIPLQALTIAPGSNLSISNLAEVLVR